MRKKKRKVTNREAHNLSAIVAKEAVIKRIIKSLQMELQTMNTEKNAILNAYGFPSGMIFDFNEETNEVVINEN